MFFNYVVIHLEEVRSFSQTIGHRSCASSTDGVIGWQRRMVGSPWELEGICSVGLYSDIVVQVLL